MNEVLTIDELKGRYPDEHLLLVDYVDNEYGQVIAGRVLCHSRDIDDMWNQGTVLGPKRAAHIFTGTIPDDIIFVL